MNEPTTFNPHLHTDDACANYWLRQVTIRLRREICWLRYERGSMPEAQVALLPPYSDKTQAALDESRYTQEKAAFFQQDVTAHYLTALLAADPPPLETAVFPQGSFGWVVQQLGLDNLGAFVLALGLSIAFDSALGSVITTVLNDPMKSQPNLALAQRLWDQPDHLLALANPNHPLFSHGLLQLGVLPSTAEMDWHSPLVAPALVANQLLFPNGPLPPGLSPITLEETAILPDNGRLVASRLQAAALSDLRVVPVLGPKGAAHIEVVQAMSATLGKTAVQLSPPPTFLENPRHLNALATLCWLRSLDLFIDEALVATTGKDNQPVPFIPSLSIPLTLFLGITERAQLPSSLPVHHLLPIINVPAFSYEDRVNHWQKALGPKAKGLEPAITEIARRFRYGKQTISAIGSSLHAMPDPITAVALTTACRAELELDIGELAQKVIPRFHHEKLILPPKQHLQFQEVIQAMNALTEVHYHWGTAQVWNEGGIAALFAGPPGTGKTMGAEVLAITLDLPMYRIDLSQVVNKYIGETEKNLKRLFDAADISDIILFFDEADSLFGQRTEVKDAHDRYANLEISYLLERMERFKGLAILATNRKKDLDEAFLRRLRFIIDFPLPDTPQRKRIWKQVIPNAVDAADIDFDFLAKQFRLAGGHIRSIVFNACLQSANGRSNDCHPFKGRLTMPQIIKAVKREYDKLNRPISLDRFGPYTNAVTQLEEANEARRH